MAFTEKDMTEHEERLVAKDIVIMLSQKGVSFERASRILEKAQEELTKVPIIELGD